MNEMVLKTPADIMRVPVGAIYRSDRLGECVVVTVERFAFVVRAPSGKYYRVAGVYS